MDVEHCTDLYMYLVGSYIHAYVHDDVHVHVGAPVHMYTACTVAFLPLSEPRCCARAGRQKLGLSRLPCHLAMLLFLMMAGVLGAPISLPSLNIDRRFGVVAVGFGSSGDFAHQFHVAFSSIVDGACVFAGQPFNCAISHFNQDTDVPKGRDTRVPNCNGCPGNMTLPFDHCKKTPHVVDVGSLVDYPRRHCGQNPVSIQECFDDVDYLKSSRVFLFRGTEDKQCAAGSIENVAALLAQMMTDPARSIKLVNDQPFPHVCRSAQHHTMVDSQQQAMTARVSVCATSLMRHS